MGAMPSTALFTEIKAKPGREEELATFLADQRSLTAVEPGDLIWMVVRFDGRTFGMLGTFDEPSTREKHLNGNVMNAIRAKVGDLIDGEPVMRLADVVADYTRS